MILHDRWAVLDALVRYQYTQNSTNPVTPGHRIVSGEQPAASLMARRSMRGALYWLGVDEAMPSVVRPAELVF